MDFCERGEHVIEREDRIHGLSDFLLKKVSLLEVDSSGAMCEVVGAAGTHHGVVLKWFANAENKLLPLCDCAKFAASRSCRHIWAAFAFLDRESERRSGLRVPGRERFEFIDAVPPGEPNSNSRKASAISARASATRASKPIEPAPSATAPGLTSVSKPANAAPASGPPTAAAAPTPPPTAPQAKSPSSSGNLKGFAAFQKEAERIKSEHKSAAARKLEDAARLKRASEQWRDRLEKCDGTSQLEQAFGLMRSQLAGNEDLVDKIWLAIDLRRSWELRRPVFIVIKGDAAAVPPGELTGLNLESQFVPLFGKNPELQTLLALVTQSDPTESFDPNEEEDNEWSFDPSAFLNDDGDDDAREFDNRDRWMSDVAEPTSPKAPTSNPLIAPLIEMTRALIPPKLLATEIVERAIAQNRLLAVRFTTGTPKISQPLKWHDDAVWTLELTTGDWREGPGLEIDARLTSGGRHLTITGSLFFEDLGFAIHSSGSLVRVTQLQNIPLCVDIATNGPLHIPAADAHEFAFALACKVTRPVLPLPPALTWEVVDGEKPINHLYLMREPIGYMAGNWLGHVKFGYGDSLVRCDAKTLAIVDHNARRIVRRNVLHESLALNELFDKPAVSTFRHFARPEAQLMIRDAHLDAVLGELSQSGWDVFAEGRVLRRPGKLSLSVNAGVDWFDLEGHVDFGEHRAQLPAILAALKEKRNYVRIKPGVDIEIPMSFRERLARLSDLGEATDGGVRFKSNQALLLDALLEAEQPHALTIDERFRDARGVAKQLGSMPSCSPPPSFKGELRPYQLEGLAWLEYLRRIGFGGCLADDMGLGKTIQILALLESRRVRTPTREDERRPSLIVVPKSLVFNWMQEAARFTPELKILNYTGSERRLDPQLFNEYDVVVTTYGTLRLDIPQLLDTNFDYAILDEAQAIKTASSQAAKACRLIRARHRLALTGTPVENHLGELWSIFEFINPGMLGQSTAFQKLVRATSGAINKSAKEAGETEALVRRTTNEVAADAFANSFATAGQGPVAKATTMGAVARRGKSGKVVKTEEVSEGDCAKQVLASLAVAVRPFILRRTKKQVLTDLPERTEQTLFCEMDVEQQKAYDEIRDYYRQSLAQKVAASGLEKSKIHVLEALLRLRQVACHPALLDKYQKQKSSAKFDVLFEQLEELVKEGHKALVFSQFTKLLDLVRTRLQQLEVPFEYLDGQTNDRQRRVERFQNSPDLKVFLISLKAGGQGLNLTAADYVFILDPWWNPAVEAQAIDRAYRIGQTRPVFAYRLICRGTVEEKIMQLQQSKRELADAIITEDNSVLRNLTSEDLTLLLS